MEVKQFMGDFANGFFIVDGDHVIAVDTGCEEGEEYYLRHCRECGIDPASIKLLVLTHGHSDHYMNTEAIRKLTGAPSLIHERDAHFMENGELPDVDICGRTRLGTWILEEQAKAGHGPVTEAPKATIDIKWSGTEYDLKPWGINGVIYLTPGHTLGSVSILLDDGSALVGDNFAQWQPETGGGPAFLRSLKSAYEDVPNSLMMLIDIGARIFYSGHGGPYTADFVKQKVEEERQGKEVGDEYLASLKA